MVEPASSLAASTDAPNSASRRMAFDLSATKVIAGRFDIDLTRPVAAFEHAYADAYECSSHETGLNDHTAVVIKGRYPTRFDVIDLCTINEFDGLMNLRTNMVVDWTPDQTQRMVLIFRRPPGNALFQKYIQKRDPLTEDIVRRSVIRPIFHTIRSLSDRTIFHGNIRPDNIFLNAHESAEATLGECISAMPGSIQPITYETIERGMASPYGRGAGSAADDIYAFGATVAVLMRGFNPLEGKPDHFVIEEKITRGSYFVLTDGLRLSPGISEFLRATLNDDPRQRWTMDQLAAWVDGNRTTPKQSSLGQRAQRAIDFNGKKYIRPRMLAKDLYENITEAVSLIESGHLMKWIERALSDNEMLNNLNSAISRASAGGRVTGYEDRLLCFVSMALDPNGPIRFKELRVFPNGIGYNLAYAYLTGASIQSFGELIRDRYAWVWLNYKENAAEVRTEAVHMFDQASKIIVRRGIDYGLERCLYELCPDVPCLSDYFTKQYVYNMLTLLRTLNTVAPEYKTQKPMDRHIASFISTRDSRDNAGLLSLLEGPDQMKRSLALITLYQIMQKRFDNPKLEDLCEWLQPDAELVAERFHSQNIKKEILKQLPKEIKSGNLSRVIMLIDNPLQVKKDSNEFVMAGRQYNSYGVERDRIRMGLDNDAEFGFRSGRQVAMLISMVLAGFMIVCTIVMNISSLVK